MKKKKKKRIKPGRRFLKPVPSCFLMLSNTTVLAGMFTPMAKVSVANSTWRMGDVHFAIFRTLCGSRRVSLDVVFSASP